MWDIRKNALGLGILAITAALAPVADGAENRIPIFGPTTLSTAGSYYVSENIAGAPAISVGGSGGQVIDLNGMTVDGLSGGTAIACGGSNVVIRNGTVVNGSIFLSGSASDGSVVLEDVVVTGGTVWVNGLRDVTLRRVVIREGALNVGSVSKARIEDVDVRMTSFSAPAIDIGMSEAVVLDRVSASSEYAPPLRITGGTAVEVRSSRLVGVYFFGYADPVILQGTTRAWIHDSRLPGVTFQGGSTSSVIEGNSIGGSTNTGVWIQGGSTNNTVRRNVLAVCNTQGIVVEGWENIIEGNTITDAFQEGILVSSERNVIRGNSIQRVWGDGIGVGTGFAFARENLVIGNTVGGCGGRGLAFGGFSDKNAYRDNTLTYNGGLELEDLGTNNTDLGGNQIAN